jgi:hypothetical protein
MSKSEHLCGCVGIGPHAQPHNKGHLHTTRRRVCMCLCGLCGSIWTFGGGVYFSRLGPHGPHRLTGFSDYCSSARPTGILGLVSTLPTCGPLCGSMATQPHRTIFAALHQELAFRVARRGASTHGARTAGGPGHAQYTTANKLAQWGHKNARLDSHSALWYNRGMDAGHNAGISPPARYADGPRFETLPADVVSRASILSDRR